MALTLQLRKLALAVALGLLAGAAGVAVLWAVIVLMSFEGFVVVALPLFLATTALTVAYMLGGRVDLSAGGVLWAVSAGALLGTSAVLLAASAVAFTWLLRFPYAAGLVFLCTAFGVGRYLAQRRR
jgi:hypothetical protein